MWPRETGERPVRGGAPARRGLGTRHTATVLHQGEDSRAKHEAMGFAEGWGKAFEQHVARMTAVAAR